MDALLNSTDLEDIQWFQDINTQTFSKFEETEPNNQTEYLTPWNEQNTPTTTYSPELTQIKEQILYLETQLTSVLAALITLNHNLKVKSASNTPKRTVLSKAIAKKQTKALLHPVKTKSLKQTIIKIN